MISFDFEYYKPASAADAVKLHQDLRKQNRRPIYYSGGTEITTLGRLNQVQADAVIDLKGIPESQVLEKEGSKLVMGAAVSFTRMIESRLFPLLGQTIRGK